MRGAAFRPDRRQCARQRIGPEHGLSSSPGAIFEVGAVVEIDVLTVELDLEQLSDGFRCRCIVICRRSKAVMDVHGANVEPSAAGERNERG